LVQHPTPFKPFLPLLKASPNVEDALPLLTSSVLSKLLSYAITHTTKNASQIDEALPRIYTYLSALATSSDAGLQDIAMQEYSALLRDTKARELFWKQRAETLEPLFNILRTASGATKDQDSVLWSGGGSVRSSTEASIAGGVGLQLLYHVLLVIWQLSFEGELVGDGLQEYVSPSSHHILVLNNYTASTTLSSSTRTFFAYHPRRKQPACFYPPF
jgi:V-type H+-transporting ATPase subunit H